MSGEKPEMQVVYERIEELKAGGTSNADAIRAVAEERGKTENAVRANQHQYRQKLGGSTPAASRRGRATKPSVVSVDDAVAQARGLLETALSTIDGEVDAAKAKLDAAQARYDELVAAVAGRKADLERKIKALT